jgi:2'-hydroxyisoflavone reductase
MHLLILGGTRFLGRALVEAALARDHQVTLFNRGQSNPDLFPGLEKIAGDRDGSLAALKGRRLEAVIDTCGYVPRVVRQSAQLLADDVEHYTFISSLSVYADASQPGVDESAPLGTLQDESIEQVNGETYGPLKALCEAEVERALPGQALIIRPGLIVGPHDHTDRFSYWPWRLAQGGDVLAPGRPERGVQFIDVRDLAIWVLAMVAARASGVFNAASPSGMWSMSQVLETCQQASGKDANLVWVPEDFLLEHQVGPWMEMPLWIPESNPENNGFFAFDVSKAQGAGLAFRSLGETVNDTLVWLGTRPTGHEWQAGMKPEREKALLSAWADRSTS